MVNKAKNKGTAGESAVVKALRANGFEGAERRALAGSADLGDILVAPGVIAEVKTGHHAKDASHEQIMRWLDETERERRNAKAALAFLVIQRTGFGLDRANMWSTWFYDLGDIVDIYTQPNKNVPVCMTLENATRVMRIAGWGTPPEPVDE